jgi:hypothetical protein
MTIAAVEPPFLHEHRKRKAHEGQEGLYPQFAGLKREFSNASKLEAAPAHILWVRASLKSGALKYLRDAQYSYRRKCLDSEGAKEEESCVVKHDSHRVYQPKTAFQVQWFSDRSGEKARDPAAIFRPSRQESLHHEQP